MHCTNSEVDDENIVQIDWLGDRWDKFAAGWDLIAIRIEECTCVTTAGGLLILTTNATSDYLCSESLINHMPVIDINVAYIH